MAMIQLPPDFKEFLRLLNSNEVLYLIVGGYAVISMATLAQRLSWISGSQLTPQMLTA